MRSETKIKSFSETAVIYFDSDDSIWIAHGLRTDQIGTGPSVVHAYSDLIKAVDQVCDLASQDESVAVLRPAPVEIQEMRQSAQALPKEIFEVAHKMARGEWPAYLNVQVTSNEGTPFFGEVEEQCAMA